MKNCLRSSYPVLLLSILLAQNAAAATISSPSGKIQFTVDSSDGLAYQVEAFGKPVLLPSSMSLSATGLPALEKQVKIVEVATRQNDTTWKPVVAGRRSTIRDHYNELTCRIESANDKGLVVLL